MQLLSHFLQSSLYFFLPRSSRKNAHSLLRYFGIRGIADTSLSLAIADLLPKRRNAQNRFPLYGFGAILGVFFRYERLCFSGGILTVRHSSAAVCRFRVTINIPPHSGGYFSFGHSPNNTSGAQVRIKCLPACVHYLLPVNGSRDLIGLLPCLFLADRLYIPL